MRRPRTIFILVDGLGMGADDPAVNPIHSGACPRLETLLRRHTVPIDACLGVPGLPQSATGQTALLTGVNAAARMGRHVEGFPGPRLREIIRKRNIYDRLFAQGIACAFANAYFMSDVEDVRRRRVQSVTTVAALKAFGIVRDTAAMMRGDAVYQDLTREILRERGYTGPLVSPEEAGRHLVAIATRHGFTLFEYFQTDRVAHRGEPKDVRRVLGLFDRFLGVVWDEARRWRWLLVLTSDHGNIEDSTTHRHTTNPVPFAAVGPGACALRKRARSILDVTPALLGLGAGR